MENAELFAILASILLSAPNFRSHGGSLLRSSSMASSPSEPFV